MQDMKKGLIHNGKQSHRCKTVLSDSQSERQTQLADEPLAKFQIVLPGKAQMRAEAQFT
jgi:hypothetical protein